MRRARGELYLFVMIAVIVILIGVVIHDPLFLGEYTDYLALYYRSPEKVLSGYPYVDYEFEYTPIIAVFWLAASKIALYLSSHGYDPFLSMLRSLFAVNIFFYIAYVYLIYRISREWEIPRILSILSIASPSIVYYLFYNWDIIATFLMILGVFLYARNRVYGSSIALGLGASVKVMPIYALFSIFITILTRRIGEAVIFALLGFSIAALPFLALLLTYPPGFFYFISYHSGWYCENCFYNLLTDDIYNQSLRTLSIILMLSMPFIYTILSHNRYTQGSGAMSIHTPLMSVALSISFSYVYSPQMNIFLAPLYLLLNNRSRYLLLIQDILNVMIMVLWFHEGVITSMIGIESRGPWFRESPIQWIAFVRIALVWVLAIIAR
ncbi:MAG TPA: glycosyltransferase 87 family protein [Sulfolobales archaeon]|nr:glycosyltransferase 87 family protein [Sulfolobales archaeon]